MQIIIRKWRDRIARRCDAYWQEGLNRGHFKVLAPQWSAQLIMQQSSRFFAGPGMDTIPYEPIPIRAETCLAVFLTAIDMQDFFNLPIKRHE